MAATLRVLRLGIGALIVVALTAQYVHSSDRTTFTTGNFFSYFTVLSNIGMVAAVLALAARPALGDDARFARFRGGVSVCMAVTGLVYAVLLAPAAADVDVNLQWVDFVVHTLAPVVAVADWLVDPPRRRFTLADAAWWLAFPLAWLVYTLIRGSVTGWYPYPFLDPDLESVTSIVITCVGITVVFALLALTLRWWAGWRLEPSPAEPTPAV